MIASMLPAGSISYLFFADRVNQLPMGVVGVAAGTALLPLLSRQVRAGDEVGARYSQNRAIEFSLFLALPAAVALVVIAGPVVRSYSSAARSRPKMPPRPLVHLRSTPQGFPLMFLSKA